MRQDSRMDWIKHWTGPRSEDEQDQEQQGRELDPGFWIQHEPIRASPDEGRLTKGR